MVEGKTPVIIRDHYVVYFEVWEGMTFIHCDVFKWNKTIREDLKHNFSLLKKLHRSPIYAVHEQHLGNKHKKFLSTFGFVHFADHMDTKGNPIEIYINEEL